MNAIIIEDEYLAAAELERLLGEVAPEITILTKLDSVSESVKWLKKNKADVIFMDIHLGDGQSFDILSRWRSRYRLFLSRLMMNMRSRHSNIRGLLYIKAF